MRRMRSVWGGLLGCLVLAAGGLGFLGGTEARADLIINVEYGGVVDEEFAALGANSRTLSQAELDALNALLAGAGANFEFTALSATSSSPIGNPGTLTQDSTVRNFAAILDSVDVLVTATDYVTGLPTFRMDSSSSTTFTNATTANTTEFTSWFNPSNVEFAQEEASPSVLLASDGPPVSSKGEDAAPTSISPDTTYGLTNLTTITVASGSTSNPTIIQTKGTTSVSAVPEPTTMALLVSALPVGALRVLRRRRAMA